MSTRERPVFLNLLQIRLPITGWVSIIHRVTGLFLFLLLPLPLYLWQYSLQGHEAFDQVIGWLSQWPLRLLLLLMAWWFVHHLFAGLRFLLMDFDKGVALGDAQGTARWVLLADVLFFLLAGWVL